MTLTTYFESRHARIGLSETSDFRNVCIAESTSFVALPTIGSLVPGWVLIVPKSHRLALAGQSSALHREFLSFQDEVAQLVTNEFGNVAMFEHGPARPASKVGCGVDHAHLHIVPTDADLLSEAKALFPAICWRQVPNLAAASQCHAAGQSYLYFHQPKYSESQYLAVGTSDLPSQLFRRVIAKTVNRAEQWDWKFFPHTANMEETCRRLSFNTTLYT